MGLTKREEKKIDQDLEKLIKYCEKCAENTWAPEDRQFRRIKSKIISLKIALHLEKKDIEKKKKKKRK